MLKAGTYIVEDVDNGQIVKVANQFVLNESGKRVSVTPSKVAFKNGEDVSQANFIKTVMGIE